MIHPHIKAPFSILALFLLFGISPVFAQQKNAVLSQIRKEFKATNNEKGLKEIALNNEDFLDHMPDGGGKLTGLYKKSQLKKIICWIGLSYGTQSAEYYFKDNQLIFVFKAFDRFGYDNITNQLRYDTKKRNFEGRYYFNSGKLIEEISKGNRDDGQKDSESTLKKEADDYRNKLKKMIANQLSL